MSNVLIIEYHHQNVHVQLVLLKILQESVFNAQLNVIHVKQPLLIVQNVQDSEKELQVVIAQKVIMKMVIQTSVKHVVMNVLLVPVMPINV